MVTFAGFSCIGADVIVKIERDPNGLYFACADGRHYLQSQVGEDGYCLGLTKLV